MPFDRLERELATHLETLEREGRRKGAERVVREVVPAEGARGPRVRLARQGQRLFLRMNSNGYLGLALHPALIAAEEAAARRFGAGPQAVRFIAGTSEPHVELERRLAAFHGREAGMIFSSAYATVMGVLPSLVTPETVVVSDALNHNCIINAIRLSGATGVRRAVYPHGDVEAVASALEKAARSGARRAVVVTDGVFSMRGDLAPLAEIEECVRRFDERFAENAMLLWGRRWA
jgi:glycine C-acetyltransferase